MTISNEAVEAAAAAAYEFQYSALEGEWGWASAVVRESYLQQACAALEAAAPIIRAECLAEAADAIDENPYDDLDPFYAGWLRDRARKIREAE